MRSGVFHVTKRISIPGWWLTYPSEKSWSESHLKDDDIPIYEMENKNV